MVLPRRGTERYPFGFLFSEEELYLVEKLSEEQEAMIEKEKEGRDKYAEQTWL
jgi:hypothetical protein